MSKNRWTVCGIIFLCLAANPVSAMNFCSNTANSVFKACKAEINDDFWVANAICINFSDRDERVDCRQEAKDDRDEAREECGDQRDARLELCEDLGEERYDPDFDPADFQTDFNNANPYFPLAVGNSWVYEGGEEVITVEVLDATKDVEGVTCIVVNDVAEEDGEMIEDTADWYGQALNGDVYYCGEIALNFETFDGDDPEDPELVDIEGSWKAGRDDAQPGIIMFAAPQEGVVFRQEVAYGDAEDVGEILSTSYSFGDDPDLDQLVPQELAELLCDDDCVVTLDYTPLDPGVEERKYWAPGIGLFLEVDLEAGEVVQLTECNFDPRCADLP